jgi:hypothetical protein
MNTQLDLLAEARALAGINPQHSLMVRVAHARLQRLAAHRDRLADVAAFAVQAVEREKMGVRIFAQDMQRKFASPDAIRRLQRTVALDVPAETNEARMARIGAVHAENSVAIPVHRAGSALWAALASNKGRKRPHSAKDDELFAALGLVLLIRGMSWRPAIGGRDGIRSIMDGGESAVRELIRGGQQATEDLLDAAECVLGWHHLKPKPELRAAWKRAFVEMLPTFSLPGGGFISAREAAKVFSAAHPQFKASVERGKAFDVDYSRLQKYYEHQS